MGSSNYELTTSFVYPLVYSLDNIYQLQRDVRSSPSSFDPDGTGSFEFGGRTFGYEPDPSSNDPVSAVSYDPTRVSKLTKISSGFMEAMSARDDYGFGGWSLNVVHMYDFETSTLHLGDGRLQRRGIQVAGVLGGDTLAVQTLFGGLEYRTGLSLQTAVPCFQQNQHGVCSKGCESLSGAIGLNDPLGMALLPDDTMYVGTDGGGLWKVTTDGCYEDININNHLGLAKPMGLEWGWDDKLYIADGQTEKIYTLTNDALLVCVVNCNYSVLSPGTLCLYSLL